MAKAKSNFSFDVVKKNLFWIFVPLAVLAMWGMFIMANSKATADYKARMEELNTLKEGTGKIRSDSAHPNQGSIDAATVSEKELRNVVYQAWEEMYRAQKLNCTWSAKLDPRFLDVVKDLKWMSPIPRVSVREWYHNFLSRQIPEFLLLANRRTVAVRDWDPNTQDWKKNATGEYIYVPIDPYVSDPDRMMRQNASLQMSGTGGGSMSTGGGGGMNMGGTGGTFTSFSAAGGGMGGEMGGSSGGMGGGGMDGGMEALGGMASSANLSLDNIFDSEIQEVTGVVDWPTPEIFTIVTWPGQSPYSGQIWYAQEEVWVYESLIRVIRQINNNVEATGPHNAAVKRIQAFLIGKNAANIVRMPGILEPLGPLTGGGMMGGMDSMDSSASSDTMGSSSSEMGTDGEMTVARILTETETMVLLLKNRYVDSAMKPLSDTDPPPFAEFNMMPVCLELIVDQRKIPEILIELANSTMPIDVKLVRYSPAKAKTGVLGGGMTGMMSGETGGSSAGMGSPMGGGMGGGMDSSMSGAVGEATEALSSFEIGGKVGIYGSDAVMIQIVGIIYIYNEPQPELLATGADAKESGLEGGVEVGDVVGATTNESSPSDTIVPVLDETLVEEEPVIEEPVEEDVASTEEDSTAETVVEPSP